MKNSAMCTSPSRCRPAISTAEIAWGDNLFSDCLVCLDAKTGKRIWHFQIVHHDIWDCEPSSPPAARRHHRRREEDQGRRAGHQAGLHFCLRSRHRRAGMAHRGAAGAPIRMCPARKPRRPSRFPPDPLPFDRQGITVDDLIDFTPELRAEAIKIARPISARSAIHASQRARCRRQDRHADSSASHRRRQLARRRARSGDRHLYVSSVTNPDYLALAVADPARSDMGYVGGSGRAGGKCRRIRPAACRDSPPAKVPPDRISGRGVCP